MAASAKTIAQARAAGYLPIPCDDPSKVVVALPGRGTAGSDTLMAALQGLAKGDANGRLGFFTELHRRLVAREKGEKP